MMKQRAHVQKLLLKYMEKKGCELLVCGSPGIGKSLEVFWAAMELWQGGNDVIWLNHTERDCYVLFMPAGEKYALSFHHIDSSIISEDIAHNLGGDAMLINDGWTLGHTSDATLQPAYTQSHQVCVASSKVGTGKTNFKQLSYASWDLDELVKAMDSSKFIKDMFIASSMISFYDILAEYFEMFIHQKDDNVPQDKLDFVLNTLATLQKKDKEEKLLSLDYAKMLLQKKRNSTQQTDWMETLWGWSKCKKFFVSNRRPDKRGCLQSCTKKVSNRH